MSKKVFNVFSILCFALVLCFIGCTELINPKTETDINLNIDLSKIIKSTRNTGETQSSASLGENPVIKVAIYDAKNFDATSNSTENLTLITQAQASIGGDGIARVKLSDIPVGIYAIVFAELSFSNGNSTEVMYAGNSKVFRVEASNNKISLVLTKVGNSETSPDDTNTPYENYTLYKKTENGEEKISNDNEATISTSSTGETKVIVTNPDNSDSVWTYFVKPENKSKFIENANYKVSVELKADKTTVVGIAAARADYFFTVNSDWTPCEFETGYVKGSTDHDFTIGLGLSSEIEIRNLKIEKLETTYTTEPSLVFDISKYAIETYLEKIDKATKIIDVSKETTNENNLGYTITINAPLSHSGATVQDVKLHLRSYATEKTGANRVSFRVDNLGANTFYTSVMADTASNKSTAWNYGTNPIVSENFGSYEIDFPNYVQNDELNVDVITSSNEAITEPIKLQISKFAVGESDAPFANKFFAIQVGNYWKKAENRAPFSIEVPIKESINFDVGLFNGFNAEDTTPSDLDDVTRFLYTGNTNITDNITYEEEYDDSGNPKFIITNNSNEEKTVKISLNEKYEVVIEEVTGATITSWDNLKSQIEDLTNSNTIAEFVIADNLVATSTIRVSKLVKITANNDVTITRGSGFPGVFFAIDTGSLELGSNDYTITVDGGKDNSITATDSLIWAYSNSESLTLTNCILQNNPLNNTDNGYGNGGAVKVESKFTMNNSSIKTCSANVNGGAVYIFAGGSFTMNGGSISDCSANDGGAVYITDGGTFTMNDDATISNCTATLSGGGVWMNGGSSFTMQETSIIESCKAINTEGGGVYVTDANSNFKMISTTSISNCSAGKGGGGVSYGCGTSEEYNFTMQDNASISNCSATNYGGGVYLYGNLVMNGGTISGCSASSGAGVYVRNDSSLSVSGNAIVNSNFVYLTSGTTVKVAGVLTNDSIVATIMLDSYTEGTQVLTAENVVTFADYVGKFALADTSGEFTINEYGKIAKVNTELNLITELSSITANANGVKQLPPGIYYLESDLVLDYPVYISTGDVVIYAKNNASIKGSSSISTDSFFSVTNGCSLTFGKDESTEVTLTINAEDKLYSNAVLNAGDNGTLNIKNNVFCTGATKQSFITTANGTVNISGGKITGNKGESPVINIIGGTVNITGGEISNNLCVNMRGACSGILVSSGTLKISGTTTTISNNQFGVDSDNLEDHGASIYNDAGTVTIINTSLEKKQEFIKNIINGEIEVSSGTGGNTGTSVTSISTNVLANGGNFVVTTTDGSSIVTITETIEISSNVSLSSESSTNKITLKRADTFDNGPMFKVKSGGTLILSDIILDGGASFSFTEADLVNKNISDCLSGIAADEGPLIYNNGGSIELNSGSILQNNWMVYSSAILGGAGIFMDGGTAVMNGAEIKNNYGNTNTVGGGGVYITGGDFTINSGVISGNYCTKRGGGVSITSSQSPVIFTMNGGSITNNACATFGGALTVYENSSSNGATIKLNAGEISNNYALASGGGVYLYLGNAQSTGYIGNGVGDEAFIISKNTVAYSGSSASGVGLYIHCSALNDDINYFEIKKGADISNNNVYNSSAKIQGLGVYLNSGNILMSGGTIHDNKEESPIELWGGGIYVNCDKFTMTGGSVTSNSLTSSESSAHGQQIYFVGTDGTDKTMIINETTYSTETSLDEDIKIN